MTFQIASHKTESWYIVMEYDKSGIIVVEVCPRLKDHYVGYPVRRMTYSSADEKLARATYRRYIRKYTD